MKNLVFFLILLSFFLDLNAQTTKPDSIDVKKVVELTIQNHPSIKEALNLINAADARINQQKTSYSPTVEADVTYARIGPVQAFNFEGMSLQLAPLNNYDAHLNVLYTVYDFGVRDAQSGLVSSYKNSAVDNVEVLKSNLAFQAIQTFYTILYLKQSLMVKDEQIENLNKHLQIIDAKIKSGTATDFDYSTTQVRVASIQNQKTDIENEIRKQEITLKNLTGLDANVPLNLSGSLEFTPENLNVDSLLTAARMQRNELKLANDAEIIANKKILVSSLSDKPVLGVALNYGVKNGFEPDIDVLRGNWTAGVMFKYPIYNGGKTNTLEEEAEANYQSTLEHTKDVELSINTEINRAASDLLSAQNQVETVKIQVDHAEKTLQRAEVQYRDGIISNLDLLDAQTGLTEAKLSELQIIYKIVINDYLLKRAVGDKLW